MNLEAEGKSWRFTVKNILHNNSFLQNDLKIIEELGENQFIIFENIKYHDKNIFDIKNLEEAISFMEDYLNYFFDFSKEYVFINKFYNYLNINNIEQYNKKYFFESVEAYKRGHFNIAILGFIQFFDFLLSAISEKDTNIEERINIILGKLYYLYNVNSYKEYLNENVKVYNNKHFFYLILTIDSFERSINKTIPFDETSPTFLNRHWIMHGRYKRTISKLDCLKILYVIYFLLKTNNFLYGNKIDLNQIKIKTEYDKFKKQFYKKYNNMKKELYHVEQMNIIIKLINHKISSSKHFDADSMMLYLFLKFMFYDFSEL